MSADSIARILAPIIIILFVTAMVFALRWLHGTDEDAEWNDAWAVARVTVIEKDDDTEL